MSVLVDFYNLGLNLGNIWRAPDVGLSPTITTKAEADSDREKIIQFFERHAPEVVKFEFDSVEDANAFYSDYQRLRELVDLYLEGKEIPKVPYFEWILALTNDVRIILEFKHQGGQVIGFTDLPDQIDVKQFSFIERIGTMPKRSVDFETYETRIDHQVRIRTKSYSAKVDLGWIRYRLCREIGRMLSGEIEVRKCEADDCDMIFIPKLKNQIYHSDKCRKRIWARKNKK